jgi:phosphoribosylanthranilate isomerase
MAQIQGDLQQNIIRLIKDSKRLKIINALNIDKLNNIQIEKLKYQKFLKEIQVVTRNNGSSDNIELLHKRLNDAILLLADKQSGGVSNYFDIKIVLDDLANGFGITDEHNGTS